MNLIPNMQIIIVGGTYVNIIYVKRVKADKSKSKVIEKELK